MGGLLNEYTKLVFHDSEKWLNDSEDKSKYCCSPETIGTKSIDEIINEEDHQDIDHERDETESEPVERCCEHLQEESYSRIHETEDESHNESCDKSVNINTRHEICCSKDCHAR